MIRSLLELDESLALWANHTARRSTRLRAVTASVAVGGSWSAAALLAGSWFRAFLASRSSERRAAERAFLSVGITYLIVEIIGLVMPRVRPFADSSHTLGLVAHPESRSFPSRHVASAFAMAVTVSDRSAVLAWCFAAIGGLLGVARMGAGVHYPSDVMAGALLGSVIGRLVQRID